MPRVDRRTGGGGRRAGGDMEREIGEPKKCREALSISLSISPATAKRVKVGDVKLNKGKE